MRKYRKANEWRELILAQQNGDLSIVAFCKKHQLSTSTFYKNRAELFFDNTKPNSFFSAKVTQSIEVQSQQVEPLILRQSDIELTLPATISVEFIADLINRLAK